MSEGWERHPGPCRASYQMLDGGKPTGIWVKAVAHPTALRPYWVEMPNGDILDQKFSLLADAQAAAMAAYEEEIGADGKPQRVIRGAGRISTAQLAQRKADAPLKPSKAQKPADIGLFSDERNQTDMFGGGR